MLAAVSSAGGGYCRLTWRVVPSPNIQDGENHLSAVITLTADDAWAGGFYWENGAYHGMMLHWDGTGWINYPIPHTTSVSDFEVITPDDIWASGSGLLHWDGQAWKLVSFSAAVSHLSAVSSDEIWGLASGNRVVRWEGTEWQFVTAPVLDLPNVHFEDILAHANNDVWIVGYWSPGSSGYYPIVQHWDGSSWSSVGIESGERTVLHSVAGREPNDFWLAGSDLGKPYAETYHWDGTVFQRKTTPSVFGDYSGSVWLFEIDALAPDDVWAVGGSYPERINSANPFIVHWDGNKWRVETVPFLPEELDSLSDISALSRHEVWAVGSSGNLGAYRTLILHGSLPCNPEGPIPAPPQLVTPDKTAFATFPIRLDWADSQGATFYNVEIWRNNVGSPDIAKSVTNSKLRIKTLPESNKRYEWRVAACNDYGCSRVKSRFFFWLPEGE